MLPIQLFPVSLQLCQNRGALMSRLRTDFALGDTGAAADTGQVELRPRLFFWRSFLPDHGIPHGGLLLGWCTLAILRKVSDALKNEIGSLQLCDWHGPVSYTHLDRTHQFYRVFQQCIQQPGRSYRFNSQEINDQQSYIVPIEGLSFAVPLHGLYQAMVLTNLLWAMVFPSTAYDHSLYNNADMVLGDGLENVLGEAFPTVKHLVDLLRTDLKDLSFQYCLLYTSRCV